LFISSSFIDDLSAIETLIQTLNMIQIQQSKFYCIFYHTSVYFMLKLVVKKKRWSVHVCSASVSFEACYIDPYCYIRV